MNKVSFRRDWVKPFIAAIFVLNVMDALMTVYWIQSGVEEANPIMAGVMDVHYMLFIVVKMAMVGMGCSVLWHTHHKILSAFGTMFALAVYSSVVFYHAQFLFSGQMP